MNIHFVRRHLTRLALFSLLWHLLAGPDVASWLIGIPAVLLATTLSMLLAPPGRYIIHPRGVIQFIPFFLIYSFQGGLDVMRRSLSPGQHLDPGLVAYTTHLPAGTARIVFANSISLLPGTLSAELNDDQLIIHTIDRGLPIWANIQGLEYHVGALVQTLPEKKDEP